MQGCHKPSIGKKNAVKRVKNTMRTCFVLLFSRDAEKSTSHGNSLLIKVDINAEKVECCPKDLASNVQGEQKVPGAALQLPKLCSYLPDICISGTSLRVWGCIHGANEST